MLAHVMYKASDHIHVIEKTSCGWIVEFILHCRIPCLLQPKLPFGSSVSNPCPPTRPRHHQNE